MTSTHGEGKGEHAMPYKEVWKINLTVFLLCIDRLKYPLSWMLKLIVLFFFPCALSGLVATLGFPLLECNLCSNGVYMQTGE